VTLYLDTSSLVKLYVDEDGSAAVAARVDAATVVATSMVAYPEARSALARRRRERALTPAAARAAVRQLDLDWPSFLKVEVTGPLASAAGGLADRLGIRGFDAIHLASFECILARSDDDVEFSSADERLTRAARRLG